MLSVTEVSVDADLLLAAKNGDGQAFSELAAKYSPLIGAAVEKYRRMCGESTDDLHQEALLAFYRAVKTYDTEKKGVTFGLYAKICINNRMISILRSRKPAESRGFAYENLRTHDRQILPGT